jgi:ketosteroid isomerase-like protein
MSEAPFDSEEISRLRELLEVEAIRKLHVDYSLAMDERDFDRLADCFADDVLCEYGPYGAWSGKETVMENYRKTFTGHLALPFTSQHINTNHTVELLSPSEAKG